MELELIQTGENHVALEHIQSLLLKMRSACPILEGVGTCETKIYNVDIAAAKHISLPQLHDVLHRHAIIKNEIVKLKIIENVAVRVYFLQDVQQLDAQGVYALVRHLSTQLHKYLVESQAVARHHDIGKEFGAVVGEDDRASSVHKHGLTHQISVDYNKLTGGSQLSNAHSRIPVLLPHCPHSLNFLLELATKRLYFDDKWLGIGRMQICDLIHLAILPTIQKLSNPIPASMQHCPLHMVQDDAGAAAVVDVGVQGEGGQGDGA